MTGKIERLVNAPRTKVERTQVETPVKTAAVSRAGPVMKNAFSEGGPAALESGGDGAHLARSAGPESLWGHPPIGDRGPNLDPRQFDALTPAQRNEKLQELSTQRDELQGRILARVSQLDQKWAAAPTATKEEALKHYLEHSDQLDPATAQELRQMLRQAAGAQRRIDHLQSRRDGMPPSRLATPETKRLRDELARELRAARSEHKAVVKEAAAVVDEKGLKVDRLAVTEQVIDPSAPKKEEGTSLLGMVKDFFKFSWLTDFLMTTITDYQDRSTEKHVHEAALQREVADYEAHVKKVGNRVAVAKLAAAAELAKN